MFGFDESNCCQYQTWCQKKSIEVLCISDLLYRGFFLTHFQGVGDRNPPSQSLPENHEFFGTERLIDFRPVRKLKFEFEYTFIQRVKSRILLIFAKIENLSYNYLVFES